MCAHKVIGMSVIALTCSAVVASTLVHTGPETKVISTVFGETSAAKPAPCVLHNYDPATSVDDRRRHELLVGNWVGETTGATGGKRRFLAQHFKDGTLRVTFKDEQPDGRAGIEEYVGNWGVSGSIYFRTLTGVAAGNVTDAADPAGSYRDRVYAILEIDDEHFEFESFAPGTKTRAQRVAASFGPHDL